MTGKRAEAALAKVAELAEHRRLGRGERAAIITARKAGVARQQIVEVSSYTPRQITTILESAGLTRRQRQAPTAQ